MSLRQLCDLPKLKLQIANLIIDIVCHRNSTGLMEFTLQDLYDRKHILDTHAIDIDATIRYSVYELKKLNQLEDTNERGRFRLVEDELLFLHVKNRRLEMELENLTTSQPRKIVDMNECKIWTPKAFLYDKFLTSSTRTSGREGSAPIDVYIDYLERDVDIDTLLNHGADIMTIVEASGLEGIEPYFFKYWIWWRYRNRNIFGILICSKHPRLMFEECWYEYLSEVYPEYVSRLYI